MLTIAAAEMRLLVRNRLVATSSIVLPLCFGLYFVFFAQVRDVAMTATAVAALTLSTAGYVAVTTALAVRRQSSMLKRLRSGAVPDAAVLAGVTGPLAILSLIQVALVTIGLAVSSGRLPESPVLIVAACLLLVATLLGLALATSRFTGSAEQAQMTTLPVFAVVMAGAIWGAIEGAASLGGLQFLLPGAGFAGLIRAGWHGADAMTLVVSFASTVVWAVLAAAAARRLFRWDRR